MAKTMTIHDAATNRDYTLEYTRKTVSQMEKQGFVVSEVNDKPMTMVPILFYGAFLAHHKGMTQQAVNALYARLPRKDELLPLLVEMYSEPILTLMDDPEDGSAEGNAEWKAGW